MKKRKLFLDILSNAGWLTGTRIAGDLASLLLFVILSRHFGPAGIGQYAYGLAIAGLTHSLVAFGLEDYGIRECSPLSREARRALLCRLLGTQFGIMVLALLVLAIFLFITRPSRESALIIILLSAYQLALAVSRTLFVPAFAQNSMVGPAVANFICRVSIFGVAIMLFAYGRTALSTALIPFPIGGLLLVVIAAISAKHFNGGLNIRVNWLDSVKIIRSVWPFAVSHIIDTLYSRAGLVILSLFLGDVTTGVYASSAKFVEAGAVPIFYLGFAVYPTLSRLFMLDDRHDLLAAVDNFQRIILFAGGLLTWALFFLVPLIMVPLLGEQFTAGVPVVQALAIVGVLMAIETAATRLLLAMHLQTRFVKLQFLGLVVLLVLNLILIPLIGVFGAVIAWVVSTTFTIVMYFIALQSQIKIMALVRTIFIFLGLLSIAFLAGVFVILSNSNSWLPGLVSLVMLTILMGSFVSIRKIV